MIIEYGNNEVRDICNDEDYARRFCPSKSVLETLKMVMYRLHTTTSINRFFQKPWQDKYHTKKIESKRHGEIISLRLCRKNRMQIRLEVKAKTTDDEDAIRILEVRGHYED
jgi:hypothetical protein